VIGDRWLDSETLKEFIYANIGTGPSWIEPAGDGGFVGATGAQGPQGNIGATGPQGIQGNIGLTGSTGPAGTSANIAIYDEGNLIVSALESINFVGAAITANVTGGNVTVNVTATSASLDAGVGAIPLINQTFTANGAQTVFALVEQVSSATDILVTVDTVIQTPGISYTAVGNQLTFLATPSANSTIGIRSFGSYSSSAGFVNNFVGNGVETTYSLSGTAISSTSMVVFVDGVYQIPNTDFTLNGNVITFNEAVDANSNVVVQSFNNTIGTNAIISDQGNILVSNVDTVVDSFKSTDYRTAKYIISVTGDTEYQATEAMLVHNNSSVQLVTYALLYTGNAAIATFSANIVGENVVFYANSVSGSTRVKLQKTYVKV
jgi:hypothetical protein